MSYEDLKIGKLVQTVLKPLIISKASVNEVLLMQDAEWSKTNFGIQYPLLLKTSSTVAEKHYYSDLFVIYGETYRLCCEWFETASNNDRPYVERWIWEHEEKSAQVVSSTGTKSLEDDWDDFFNPQNETKRDWKDFFAPTKKEQIVAKDGISIGEAQYKGREDLTVVEIPDGVAYIGREAFAFCSNIKEIIIPDSVVCIDEAAFWCCSSLENVKLPTYLRYIGVGAFGNCSSLQRISIPHQITVIPDCCFIGCTSLKEVQVSSGVRVIMDSAFSGCKNLSFFSLYGCERLNAILNCAFRGCGNFVFETLDQKVFVGDYGYGFGSKSIMIDKEAFDWENLTIRTFKGTAGAKIAEKWGLKVEYVKDER